MTETPTRTARAPWLQPSVPTPVDGLPPVDRVSWLHPKRSTLARLPNKVRCPGLPGGRLQREELVAELAALMGKHGVLEPSVEGMVLWLDQARVSVEAKVGG